MKKLCILLTFVLCFCLVGCGTDTVSKDKSFAEEEDTVFTGIEQYYGTVVKVAPGLIGALTAAPSWLPRFTTNAILRLFPLLFLRPIT